MALGLVAIAALAATLAVPGWSLARAPAPPAGFTTTFLDDFDGPAGTSPSIANWFFDTGHNTPGGPPNFGTGEVERMTSSTSNVFQDGRGNLHIRALRDAAGSWASGRLETRRDDFAPPPGGVLRFQASIALPNVSGNGARGYWPAFWALGTPLRTGGGSWPSAGELDFMESVNAVATEFGAMHCGTNPGGPCSESAGIGGRRSCACWGQFHTYTVEWDRSVTPETIRWLLDGTRFFSIDSIRVDAGTWANATNHPYFLVLDLAMGGGFPATFGGGPTPATVSGGEMVVDYVAVYTRPGGGAGTRTPINA